jgi:excinuclease ABC subunit A
MSKDRILVVGARENNLKHITVEIPRDKLVVITGLSGSGKSSLAFDTIYAEGQRRYVESLSAYARQFLGQMDKPDVDHIDGLSPAVSIDQKSTSKNPRSTVGTVTEIYDYLRILFARAGTPYCPNGHGAIQRQSTDQVVDKVLQLPDGAKIQVLAPVVQGRKGEYKKEILDIKKAGYTRVRVDGEMYEVDDDIPMDRYKMHTIEVVVDRLVKKEGLDRRLADSVEAALKMGKGTVCISSQLPGAGAEDPWADELFSESYSCPVCGFSMPEPEPRLFSFNSPYGACPDCNGLGTKTEFDPELLIPNTNLPLKHGAIAPFVYKSGETKDWWPEVLQGVGEHVGFDANTPVKDISDEHMHFVWQGIEGQITVTMRYTKSERKFKTSWDGVFGTLRKKYEQTESEWVKKDLEQYMSTKPCPTCAGQRLKPEALCVKLPGEGFPDGVSIADLTEMSVITSLGFFDTLNKHLSPRQLAIAERAVKEVAERLRFLNDVGLSYLTMNRTARTLAGGEAQRIRLATQIGSGLMGCLYVLDEPSIGLHQRDNRKLIQTLQRLRDLGNTVIVVEHDEETMLAADWLIDLGPGAGELGGEIINEGTVEKFLEKDSGTAAWLKGIAEIPIPKSRRQPGTPDPIKNPEVAKRQAQAVLDAEAKPKVKAKKVKAKEAEGKEERPKKVAAKKK